MPSKTWGTKHMLQEYRVVENSAEIPTPHKAFIFAMQSSEVAFIINDDWYAFMDGDVSAIRNDIENQISGSKVLWIRVSWDSASILPPPQTDIAVKGFRIEALVENVSAGLTGLEIVAIILAVTFMAAVVTFIALGAWVTWEVLASVPEEIRPIVGIILLIIIATFILLLFGGQLGITRKKVTVKGRKK